MEHKLLSNFHTHTKRCMHAKGEDFEYVEGAIKAGIKRLGFSDHIAVPYDGGYISGIRMSMEEAYGYRESIERLKSEYKSDIEIFAGFEMEYFPNYFDKQMRMIEELDFEYLLLGQHHFISEIDGPYFGSKTVEEGILTDYVDTVTEAMKTGKYLYLAHPDLCNFVGDTKIYKREMKRLCNNMKELNIPLEINGLGVLEGRHYPNETFFELAKETGNSIVIGLDAHSPVQVMDTMNIEKCFRFAEKFGFEIVNEKLM